MVQHEDTQLQNRSGSQPMRTRQIPVGTASDREVNDLGVEARFST
jgi:hypothetical protein